MWLMLIRKTCTKLNIPKPDSLFLKKAKHLPVGVVGFYKCSNQFKWMQESSFCSDSDQTHISAMRKPYKDASHVFDVNDLVSADPFKQFEAWFGDAKDTAGTNEANAMALATATKDGVPSVRMVLMKGLDHSGVYFYTNFHSQKATELMENPHCCLMFYWEHLNRSVRISGEAQRVTEDESTKYFHSRPRASQIGACVSSHQSSVVRDRKTLDERNEELTQKYSDEKVHIPKPDYWGGFKVVPSRFEFWQGQSNRIHDRILFRKPQQGEVINSETTHTGLNGWIYERLMP